MTKKAPRARATLVFIIFFFLPYLNFDASIKLKIADYCQMMPINSSSISERTQNANAYIYIEHTHIGDLVIDLGLGDPDNPDWSINIWNKEGSETRNLNITVDIFEANNFLPPSKSSRWFLKVYDANNKNQGQISKFIITYHGQTYISTCIPVAIHDLQTSLSYIPDIPIELAISRRISIRDFPSTENYTFPKVTWKILSQILWAGYGVSSYGRTVPNICGSYPINIYVCNETAVYRYNPENHELDLWKEGDHRFSQNIEEYPGRGTHKAPVELFITLDTDKSPDIYMGAIEAGCIIQNIYLEANALGLGTVCVGGVNSETVPKVINLPANEYILYNMPLGYPESFAFYNFTSVEPFESSSLPKVKQSSVFLDDSLLEIKSSHDWQETSLTPQEISQILWSAYGRSYLKDMRTSYSSFKSQHRTVPSAQGRYPLLIYIVNSTGIFSYNSWSHGITLKIEGDKRAEIIHATSRNWISTPNMLLIVWNSSKSDRQDWAYTEVGFVIQNVHLESVALNLTADWSTIDDKEIVKNILGLEIELALRPIAVIPIGHPLPNHMDKIPPQIGTTYQYPSKENVMVTQNVKVSVNILDKESGVKNVTLYYTLNNGTTWSYMPMNFNITSKLYEAILPSQNEETWIKYYIIAYDNAGNGADQKFIRQFYVQAGAQFEINKLLISPVKVNVGEKATITSTITNVGKILDSYTAELKINGVIEETKELILDAGESTTVTFEVTKFIEGTYNIELDDKKGILEVMSTTILSVWIYAGIIAVIMLIVAFIWLIRIRLS